MSWFVYLLECRNGAIYTGIAVDVERRVAAHRSGRGARYTRGNPPVRVLAVIAHPDRSSASIHEARIKRLDTKAKRALATSIDDPAADA